LLSESGAAQIWSEGAEPTLANSGMPGAAVPVDGGYRLSGHWKIVSGIHAADWFIAVGVVSENGQPRITQAGAPDIRLCAVRRDQLKADDTWNVSGMRGTGSHDIEVEDLFVPEEHTFSALDRRARVTGPMNRMHGFDLAGCAGISLLGAFTDLIAVPVKFVPVDLPAFENRHSVSFLHNSSLSGPPAKFAVGSGGSGFTFTCH